MYLLKKDSNSRNDLYLHESLAQDGWNMFKKWEKLRDFILLLSYFLSIRIPN